MKKKINNFFFIIICLILITGCSDKNKNDNIEEKKYNKNSILNKIDVDGSGELHCNRVGFGSNDITAEMNYTVKYKNGYLSLLHSMEKVSSNSSENLDLYEDAYKKISLNYKNIEHYNIKIIRKDDYVLNDTVINYEKVDTNKILDVEGRDNNLIHNGKLYLKTWVEFAEKLGVSCDKVD